MPESSKPISGAGDCVLQVTDLEAGYGRGMVLQGVSLQVGRGETVAVLGSNGAGKTTLLRAVSGLIGATGSVRFDGREVLGKAAHSLRELGIAHVPEGRGLFPSMTVEDNLLIGLLLEKRSEGRRQRLDWAYDLFPRLKERRMHLAGSLSGGEQQMLAIARSIMVPPKLLLVDEPSMGLAPRIVDDVFDVLGQIVRDHQTSLLLVEQNVEYALSLANRAYVLETGRLVMEGPAEVVKDDPRVRMAYLGEAASP